MIQAATLEKLYNQEGLSMAEISTLLDCSIHKVSYWMSRHGIIRRSISDAIYLRNNPGGDPFTIMPITTQAQAELFGLGIGLYWGEGNKANKHSVRLGNSDPALIVTFIRFLTELYAVDRNCLHFGLQLFSDTNKEEALDYWVSKLNVKHSQFYKVTVTISGSIGTYRHKSKYGVVTVYFNNKKLRDILVGLMPR